LLTGSDGWNRNWGFKMIFQIPIMNISIFDRPFTHVIIVIKPMSAEIENKRESQKAYPDDKKYRHFIASCR
jgi:hypothetical protein